MTRRPPLALCLLLAACASSQPAPPPRPFRFAVVPAPALGAPDALDRLYMALDKLSAEGEGLDLVLVPGPLLAGEDEGLPDELAGVLGSLPAPTVVASGPADLPRRDAIHAALERAFVTQDKARRARHGWQALPVLPDGTLAPPPANKATSANEEASDDPPAGEGAHRIALLPGGVTPAGALGVALEVAVGDEVSLVGGPVARLTLPPLATGPHLLAVATISPEGTLEVRLLALEGQAPQPPEPVSLDVPPGDGTR